jgi:hypothetical protein
MLVWPHRGQPRPLRNGLLKIVEDNKKNYVSLRNSNPMYRPIGAMIETMARLQLQRSAVWVISWLREYPLWSLTKSLNAHRGKIMHFHEFSGHWNQKQQQKHRHHVEHFA